jgi:hypothetical protein
MLAECERNLRILLAFNYLLLMFVVFCVNSTHFRIISMHFGGICGFV